MLLEEAFQPLSCVVCLYLLFLFSFDEEKGGENYGGQTARSNWLFKLL